MLLSALLYIVSNPIYFNFSIYEVNGCWTVNEFPLVKDFHTPLTILATPMIARFSTEITKSYSFRTQLENFLIKGRVANGALQIFDIGYIQTVNDKMQY